MRYVDHITIDGKTYYTGTVFIIPGGSYPFYGNCEASFICYEPEYDKVTYHIDEFGHIYNRRDFLTSFKKRIISVKEEKNERVKCPVKKRKKELNIDGMFEGWLLYIVAMAVSTIFKDNVGLWALWSFTFFTWRAGKIEKEGYYYEW